MPLILLASAGMETAYLLLLIGAFVAIGAVSVRVVVKLYSGDR